MPLARATAPPVLNDVFNPNRLYDSNQRDFDSGESHQFYQTKASGYRAPSYDILESRLKLPACVVPGRGLSARYGDYIVQPREVNL